jgi:hypothetical protein
MMEIGDALALAAFLSARIGEEEHAAWSLHGTEWTALRLDDHDHEIRVQHDPLLHGTTAPTRAIADVQREDVAEWIAAHSPRQAQRDLQPDHALIAEYAQAREMTPNHYKAGYIDALEWVIKTRVARYGTHPDYQEKWKP